MGGIPFGTMAGGRADAARLQEQMQGFYEESVRSSARLAGLAAGKVTQTRARPAGSARPASGGLASGGGGGQAQRQGGIQGGKIGGPLGKRGPASVGRSRPTVSGSLGTAGE